MKASSKVSHFQVTVVGLLVIFPILASAANSAIVTTLPGFDGLLPFTLETGYVGVGNNGTEQLFYYFVESQRSPSEDPVVFWIDGGPGCSSAFGFFFQSGPLQFRYSDYDGGIPSLHLNPYSWTLHLNMIYVDAPIGTGFSYSPTDDILINDYTHAAQSYEFVQKWFLAHPQYLENELYIAGTSYSGIAVPMMVKYMVDGKARGDVILEFEGLEGYIMNNPVTDSFLDGNQKIPFAHRLTLISDALYKTAKKSCNGDFVNIDPNNVACVTDVDTIDELKSRVLETHVLEPNCANSLPHADNVTEIQKFLKETKEDSSSSSLGGGPHVWCRSYNHELCIVWANHLSVQEALNVRPGTKLFWKLCNSSMPYTYSVTSVLDYHVNLTKTNLRALIFSRDHDMSIPYMGTRNWIKLLNLTLIDSWRAWSVDGQTAGYTEKHRKDNFTMTFATLKGAGHFAAEFKVKEASAMAERWMSYNHL